MLFQEPRASARLGLFDQAYVTFPILCLKCSPSYLVLHWGRRTFPFSFVKSEPTEVYRYDYWSRELLDPGERECGCELTVVF